MSTQPRRKRGQEHLNASRETSTNRPAKRRSVFNPESWNAMFGQLERYKSEHGHCNVPKNQTKSVGWVSEQRKIKGKDELHPDRASILESIGFEWSVRTRTPSTKETWDTMFGQLERYKAEHGHCNVPQRQGKLGRWVSTQRQAKARDELDPDRASRLESIGFEWSVMGPKLNVEARADAPTSPPRTTSAEEFAALVWKHQSELHALL